MKKTKKKKYQSSRPPVRSDRQFLDCRPALNNVIMCQSIGLTQTELSCVLNVRKVSLIEECRQFLEKSLTLSYAIQCHTLEVENIPKPETFGKEKKNERNWKCILSFLKERNYAMQYISYDGGLKIHLRLDVTVNVDEKALKQREKNQRNVTITWPGEKNEEV